MLTRRAGVRFSPPLETLEPTANDLRAVAESLLAESGLRPQSRTMCHAVAEWLLAIRESP